MLPEAEPVRIEWGTARADGYRFMGYRNKKGKRKEVWASPGAWDRRMATRREHDRKYYANNTVKAIAASKKWQADNREKVKNYAREYAVEWDSRNPGRRRGITAVFRAENPKWTREYSRQYARKYPDRLRNHNALRRAKLRSSATGMPEVCEAIYEVARRVTECLGIPHEVDHHVPLRIGGAHVPANLRVLPRRWNIRKGCVPPEVFYAKYPFLVPHDKMLLTL